MPKQHNALYGADLHNPKGMSVESYASASKFVISASNMTITASGYTIKATAFLGDGSGITGVPANDWDGSHTGDGTISGTLTAGEFVGGGAGITGITGEWDGSHTGTATFTGNVTSSGNISASLASTGSFGRVQATTFVGDGSGITGVTGEWDGSHTGTATFIGNVTASGVVSASGGFVGDGSSLTGVGGGGLTHDFYASSSLVTGDAVIINADGSVKKVESETVARKIPMKDYGTANGTWYNSAGWEFDNDRTNAQKKISYDPNAADRFVFAYADYGSSNDGKARVGTISIDTSTSDNNLSKVEYGGASTFESGMGDYLYLCEFIPGSSTKFVVMYKNSATAKISARVGTISGTAPNETIAFGTEAVMADPNDLDHAYNVAGVMDPSDTTNGTMIVIAGTDVNSGSAWIGTVSGTSFSWGREYSMTTADLRYTEIAADPNNSGKFCAIYDDQSVNVSLSSNIITRSGTALSFGSVQRVTGGSSDSPSSIAYDPNTTNSIAICLGSSSDLVAGVQSGTSVTWGSKDSSASIVGGRIRFNPHIAGVWGIFHQYGPYNTATAKFTHGTLSGTSFTTANSATYQQLVVSSNPQGLDFDFDKVTPSKFSVIFGGTGGYEETSGRVSVGQLAGVEGTNLTTSNWAGMATGTTSLNGTASITTRGGVATDITGSGLVPGTVYYLQGDSSLATTAGTPSVKAGKALSATSIILTAAPLDVDGSPYATSAQGTTADTALTNAATAQTTANAALPKAGGAMTGAITTNSTFDGKDVSTLATTAEAHAYVEANALALTAALTTNSTIDGIDIATRDGILTSTTTTAGAALPKAGGTMTGGLIGTTATFTGNVSSSLTSTGSFGMVLVGGSVLASADGFDYSTSSSPVITTNPSSLGATWINTTSGEIFVATDITTDENVWMGTNSSSIAPQAVTYFGARGVWAGGYDVVGTSQTNTIDYITIATTGNATDFGNLTNSRYDPSGCADSSKGVFGGGQAGNTSYNNIDYVTIASTGDATDFGDLTVGRAGPAALSNGTRGIWGGGTAGNSRVNTIDYITIATTGNAADFGDLTLSRQHPGAASNGTRGMWAGGYIGGNPSYTKVMDYVTIATLGNATSFGDLNTWGAAYVGGTSDGTKGVFAGGYSSSYKNWILYVVIATTSNSNDFGDLTLARKNIAAASDGTKGVFGGGYSNVAPYQHNTMDYVTIASTGNASDFGDLSLGRDRAGACSG
jgi:hypothetical protein